MDRLRKTLLEATEAPDAKHIKVRVLAGTPAPIAQVTETFAELCADAAEHGTGVVFELMPFDPNVTNLDDLLAVGRRGGCRPHPGHLAHREARDTVR